MGQLRVDVDALYSLSKTLQQFADRASTLFSDKDSGPYSASGAYLSNLMPNQPLLPASSGPAGPKSVEAAATASSNLVANELIPSIQERLHSTSFVMSQIGTEYQNQDDTNRDQLVAAYNGAVGEWTEPGEPA